MTKKIWMSVVMVMVIVTVALGQRGQTSSNAERAKLPEKAAKFRSDLLLKEIKYADLIVLAKVADNRPNPKNTVVARQATQMLTLSINDVLKGNARNTVVVNVPVKPFLKAIVESKKGTPNVYLLFSDGPGTDTYHITFPDDVQPVDQAGVIRGLARN